MFDRCSASMNLSSGVLSNPSNRPSLDAEPAHSTFRLLSSSTTRGLDAVVDIVRLLEQRKKLIGPRDRVNPRLGERLPMETSPALVNPTSSLSLRNSSCETNGGGGGVGGGGSGGGECTMVAGGGEGVVDVVPASTGVPLPDATTLPTAGGVSSGGRSSATLASLPSKDSSTHRRKLSASSLASTKLKSEVNHAATNGGLTSRETSKNCTNKSADKRSIIEEANLKNHLARHSSCPPNHNNNNNNIHQNNSNNNQK